MKKTRVKRVEEEYYECPVCHSEYQYQSYLDHCDKCGQEWCQACQNGIAYHFPVESRFPGGQKWEKDRYLFLRAAQSVLHVLTLQQLEDNRAEYIHLCAGCAQELQNTLATFGLHKETDIQQEIKDRRKALKMARCLNRG